MARERDHRTLQTDGWPVRDRGVSTLDGAAYDWSSSRERDSYGRPLESGSLLPDIEFDLDDVVSSVGRVASSIEFPVEARRRPPLDS